MVKAKKSETSDRIHSGHRQRVKQRFLKEGLVSFADHQVLELLLFYGLPYQDTNGLAHILYQRFGSLAAVLDADYHDLMEITGIGSNTALLLTMIPEITRRYLIDKASFKTTVHSLEALGEYAVNLFIGRHYEAFYLICLDSQNHILCPAMIAEGTINEVSIYPRIVVETALRHKAKSVALAHNHPGGSLRPTAVDMQLTQRIALVLAEINIEVLDHIIVCNDEYLSFAAKGLMFND